MKYPVTEYGEKQRVKVVFVDAKIVKFIWIGEGSKISTYFRDEFLEWFIPAKSTG